MKDWLAQAWGDWIRPLGLIIVAALAYLGYRFDFISEPVAGVGLVIAVVGGVLVAAILPAWGLTRSPAQRGALVALGALALVGAGWPCLRAAMIARPIASAHLTEAQPRAVLATGRDGPYDLIVSGRFKQAGASDVEASYTIKVEGAGSAQISGAIKRALHRYRTSRRGGSSTSIEERTEAVHRVDGVRGASIAVSTDGIDEQLEGGLEVGLRPAGPRPEVFWVLCALAVLIGLVLDARLVVELREEERKVRGPKRDQSYLTVASAMLLVFAINFPMEATPRSLVRAAVGAFFLALLAGGAGGWLLAAFVRLAAKPRRRA